MTKQGLIERALRLIGYLQSGERASASELEDAGTVLLSMIDLWGAERLTIYHEARMLFPLVSGQQDYTLGPGGDFDVARPVYMTRVSAVSQSDGDQPLELPLQPILSLQQWQTIVSVKNVDGALPTYVYQEYSFPKIALSYWPIPSVTNLQTALYLPTAITGFADLTTDYTFPPGYQDALTYNLALRLVPEFAAQVPQIVQQLAVSTLATVKRSNIRIEEMVTDPILSTQRGFYNWLSDGYGPGGQ